MNIFKYLKISRRNVFEIILPSFEQRLSKKNADVLLDVKNLNVEAPRELCNSLIKIQMQTLSCLWRHLKLFFLVLVMIISKLSVAF